MKKVKPISPAIKSFSNTQKINSVGWTILFCLTSSQLALAQSNNQGSLTPARAASIATSTAITSSIINNPFGGFGTYRWKLGANSNNPSLVLEAKNPNSLNPDDYSGGLAGSADWSNWSVWATPVISQFKNNIAPNTSNGTVVIGLAGLEYNMDDTLISGLSLHSIVTNMLLPRSFFLLFTTTGTTSRLNVVNASNNGLFQGIGSTHHRPLGSLHCFGN